MKCLTFTLLSLSTLAFADNIAIECGKGAGSGLDKAELGFSSESTTPKERNDWSLLLNGKENKNAESVVTLRKDGRLSGYVVTERKPLNGHAYRQFIFTGVENCGDGGPAFAQIYKVGSDSGKEPIGSKKKCVCDID